MAQQILFMAHYALLSLFGVVLSFAFAVLTVAMVVPEAYTVARSVPAAKFSKFSVKGSGVSKVS